MAASGTASVVLAKRTSKEWPSTRERLRVLASPKFGLTPAEIEELL